MEGRFFETINFFTLIYFFFHFPFLSGSKISYDCVQRYGFKVLSSAVLCLFFVFILSAATHDLWKHGDEQVHGFPLMPTWTYGPLPN